MAGDWLKFDVSTPEKPEVFAITTDMGWDDPDTTVGKLLRVWRWFDQHTVDGNAENVTSTLLDRICGVTGFANAMCKVGWLIEEGGVLTLPNFDRHNGSTAKNRSETAKRVATHRARKEGGDTKDRKRSIIPRPVRAMIMNRDNSTCVYCGRKEGQFTPPEMAADAVIHLDHVIPETRGGATDPSNLVCACRACNMFKGDRTPDECGLPWPMQKDGTRFGNAKPVTTALPREEKRRDIELSLADVPKTAADVVNFGKTLVPPAAKDFCESWFEEHESRGWSDRRGQRVLKWKPAFSSAWRNARHSEQERNHRYGANQRATRPGINRNAGTHNENAASEYGTD